MQRLEDKDRVGIRLPPKLKKLINRFLETSATYLNTSELVRAALREKIQRDAPWLQEEVLRPEEPQTPEGVSDKRRSTVEHNK